LALNASTVASILTKWANPINGKEREWRKKGLKDPQRKGMFLGGGVFSGRRLRT